MNYIEMIVFIVYFVFMLGIGLFFFFRSKSGGEKEYFLGGRAMGPWVTAMSAQASDMSGWLLMGFPGSILAFGMGKVWIGIGLALGTAANWIFVAKRLRRFSRASGDSITLPQYLTNRFASQSSVLKIVCAVIFLISFTVYVSSAFVAGKNVMTAVIPQLADSPMLAMAIFAVFILLYTFLGGYKAVCWTDFFQGILMLIALLAVPIIMTTGNFDSSFNGAFADGITAFGTNPFTASWQDIVSGLAWGLGYFGMPQVLLRFMAIRKTSELKKSRRIATVWVVISLFAAVCIGVIGRAIFPVKENLLTSGGAENVFINLSAYLLPALLAGVVMAGILAATISSSDSYLLIAASALAKNIYQGVVKKDATDKQVMLVSRITLLVIAIIAAVIALDENSVIFKVVSFAWAGFGATFGPIILFSLFWKRTTRAGAIAGMLAGGIMVFFWEFVLTPLGGVFAIYELLPAFLFSCIAIIIASLLSPKPSAEIEAEFEAAKVYKD